MSPIQSLAAMLSETTTRQFRVFISSTFKDMEEERDYLVKNIFPRVRTVCRRRGVQFSEVDLRWGITESEADNGEVIPICLGEIDNSRPYFIGLIGERYGWIPPKDAWGNAISESYEHVVREAVDRQMSITEAEIYYGVLHDAEMMGKACFFIRDKNEFPKASDDEALVDARNWKKLAQLKGQIIESACENRAYGSLEQLGNAVEGWLIGMLDADFPEGDETDKRMLQRESHVNYIRERIGLYVGGEKSLKRMNMWFEERNDGMIIRGEKGSGKSALVANFLFNFSTSSPEVPVLFHFLGSTPENNRAEAIMGHIIDELELQFGVFVPRDKGSCKSQFELALQQVKTPLVLVLDGLDQLDDNGADRMLDWLPQHMNENIRLLCSVSPGDVAFALTQRGMDTLEVEPLATEEIDGLMDGYLAIYRKKLEPAYKALLLETPLFHNPLILLALLGELRVFGSFEQLPAYVQYYAEAESAIDFFDRILQRLEADYRRDGESLVGHLLAMIALSRKGLQEEELIKIAVTQNGTVPIPMLYLRQMLLALDGLLVNRGGFYSFGHDYFRKAVFERYLQDKEAEKPYRMALQAYFSTQDRLDERTLCELPNQLFELHADELLCHYLSDVRVVNALVGSEYFLLARYWSRLQDNYPIHTVYEEAVNALYANYEVEPEYMIRSLINISVLIMKTTRLTEAGPFLYSAYEVSKKGEVSPVVMGQLFYYLGYYNIEMDRLDEALELFKVCRNIGIEYAGEIDYSVVDVDSELAFIYHLKGQFDHAKPLFESVLQKKIEIYGEQHLEIVPALNNLGECLHMMGEVMEAVPLFNHALTLRQHFLPENHPQIATSMLNFGAVLDKIGQQSRANELNDQALKVLIYNYGEKSVEVLDQKRNVALNLLSQEEQWGRAEELLLECIHGYRDIYVTDRPELALSYDTFSRLKVEQKDFDSAGQLMCKAMAMMEQIHGKGHHRWLASAKKMSEIYASQGKLSAGIALREEVLNLVADNPGCGLDIWEEQFSFALYLLINNEDVSGREMLLEYENHHLASSDDLLLVAVVSQRIGEGLLSVGYTEEGFRYWVKAFETHVKRDMVYPGGMKVLKTLWELEQEYTAMGDEVRMLEVVAVDQLQRPHQIILPPVRHFIATCCINLSRFFFGQNDLDKCEQYSRMILSLEEKNPLREIPDSDSVRQMGNGELSRAEVALAYVNLGTCAHHRNNQEKKGLHYANAVSVYLEMEEPDVYLTNFLVGNYVDFLLRHQAYDLVSDLCDVLEQKFFKEDESEVSPVLFQTIIFRCFLALQHEEDVEKGSEMLFWLKDFNPDEMKLSETGASLLQELLALIKLDH